VALVSESTKNYDNGKYFLKKKLIKLNLSVEGGAAEEA